MVPDDARAYTYQRVKGRHDDIRCQEMTALLAQDHCAATARKTGRKVERKSRRTRVLYVFYVFHVFHTQ